MPLRQGRRSLGVMTKTVVTTFMLLIGSLSSPSVLAAGDAAGLHLAPDPKARLEEAVRLYQTGHHSEAKSILTSLVNDPHLIDQSLRQRARVYLGEVLYLQQNKEEARRLFEAVLIQDPDYVIDPFAHPPDVCGFFETIRAYIRPVPSLDPPPTSTGPTGRAPLTTYTGFGVYQFQSGRPALGAVMAGSQAALGALSLATFYGLTRNNTWETESRQTTLDRRRALQWGATAGFYGVWMWGVVDAHRHWRAAQGQPLAVQGMVGPTLDGRGASLTMSVPIR